jgi:signal transduction histidine kinase/ActR/RegA family two-component response regulator/HAMP domain-containing protein
MKFPGGIRSRLLLLAATCTLPVFLLLAYDGWQARQGQIDAAKADLRARSRAAAEEVSRDIRSGHALVRSLAQIAGTLQADPGTCSENLAAVAAPYTEIGSAFIVDRAGVIRCTTSPDGATVRVTDRDYFQRALESASVVQGVPTQSRRTPGRFILPLAVAARDPEGRVTAVVAIGINISRFAQDVLSVSVRETILTWWGIDGRILFRWPDPLPWIGTRHPDSPLARAVQEVGAGSIDEKSPDGVERVHGIAEIGSTGQSLTLSVTREALLELQTAAFNRNIAVLGLIMLGAFASAWLFGEVLIRRPLAMLARFGQRMAEGDLGTRSELHGAGGEIGRVASAFDRMADALSERIGALHRSEDRLKQSLEHMARTEQRLRTQLEYMNLLDQITRAIGDKLDLTSIFQVIVSTLGQRLPVDFACIAMYDDSQELLRVASVVADRSILERFDAGEPIAIDDNGLRRCLGGQVVHEPDIRNASLPFPRRLGALGLRALVLAPLRAESRVFGVLVAARHRADSFSSTECEFLRQLSEHAALAAHQAQLHQALRQAYEDLRQTQQVVMQEERLRALGQMASGVAHDINNALSPVSLYTTTLLETDTSLSERARSYLETIQRAVDDVAQTVARMREFYRRSDERLETTAVDLNLLVRQVLDLTRAKWGDMAQRQGVSIAASAELDERGPTCQGTESEIREALINLVFNAVDAMPQGGRLVLRTACRDDSGGAVVEVRDSGVGMSESVRQRCLEPFFTTKGERGTGLGLAMVFGTMQRHGGSVEIQSEPGAGTVFGLVFPPNRASGAGQGGKAPVDERPPRMRLLLVDDDPILLRSLRDALESDGHVVATADGGAVAIEMFRRSIESGAGYDAVITDLGMPQVDGRKVAAAVKACASQMPVVLLTGWGQRLVAEDDVPAHVDQLVAKPPRLPVLRKALLQVVRRNAAAVVQ